MTFIKDRPKRYKRCRWCNEWFELPVYAKPTRRFCTRSCGAKWRSNQPAFKKAQSERSKVCVKKYAQKLHDAVQALWADPERRAVQVEKARERSNRPQHLAWMQEHNKRIWKDPEFRKRHVKRSSKMMQERWRDPEALAKNAAQMSRESKKRWADPVKRQTMSWSIKIAQLAPLTVKKKRELGRVRMSTPENKAMASANLKKLWANPEMRARFAKEQGERMKKRWRDPKYRALKAAQGREQARRKVAGQKTLLLTSDDEE